MADRATSEHCAEGELIRGETEMDVDTRGVVSRR
jgi:hypothetical protein